MANSGEIHWHEGLFLQPHHLQMLSRWIGDRFGTERRLWWSYPYGIVEIAVSGDALENYLVKIDRLRAIMPSGLEVVYPGNAEIPPLDIKQSFAATSNAMTISLAVPLWYPDRANTMEMGGADEWRSKRLYRLSQLEQTDENTGENRLPVLVRRLNARLIVEGDDETDLEILPLLRIVRDVSNPAGLPRQQSGYVPPCLIVSASHTLRVMVADLASQVEASRKELVTHMTRGGFSIETVRGPQFEQMLRLQTLSRFSARLSELATAPVVPPLAIFMEMKELLSELAALHPEREAPGVAAYDHQDPGIALADLNIQIRERLRGMVKSTFLKTSFNREGASLIATLSAEHLTAPNDYYLGIKTRNDPRAVALLVEDGDRFKMMPKSQEALRIRGIKLVEERHPPLELPSETGLNYFRLNRTESARTWERVKEERSLSIRWPEMDSSDFVATLFMTVP